MCQHNTPCAYMTYGLFARGWQNPSHAVRASWEAHDVPQPADGLCQASVCFIHAAQHLQRASAFRIHAPELCCRPRKIHAQQALSGAGQQCQAAVQHLDISNALRTTYSNPYGLTKIQN